MLNYAFRVVMNLIQNRTYRGELLRSVLHCYVFPTETGIAVKKIEKKKNSGSGSAPTRKVLASQRCRSTTLAYLY
jgi:hypothetical protein